MRALGRKRKNLPEFSLEEAQIAIKVKRFAPELNPGPNTQERGIPRVQLERTCEDVANEVSGAHWHLWKNFPHRDKQKMRRPLAALGIATALSFALAACVGGVEPKNHTSAPKASQSASAAPAVGNVLGDAIVLGKVTDSFGTYESTTIDPKSGPMQYDPTKIDQSAFDKGFTKESIHSAQQYIVKFVSEQGLDSPAVDQQNTGWDDWKNKAASKYLLPSQSASILNAVPPGFDRSLVVIDDPNNAVPQLVRDGKPRIANQTTVITKISGLNDSSVGNYLWIEGKSIVNYRVSDAEAQKSIMANKNNAGKTSADVKAEHPEFFDGKENVMFTTFTWVYAVVKDAQGNWKIGGFNNNIETNLQQ